TPIGAVDGAPRRREGGAAVERYVDVGAAEIHCPDSVAHCRYAACDVETGVLDCEAAPHLVDAERDAIAEPAGRYAHLDLAALHVTAEDVGKHPVARRRGRENRPQLLGVRHGHAL